MPTEQDHITIRDLIYLYLRELDLVQKSIERIENDIRHYCQVSNDDYTTLNAEINDLKNTVNELSTRLTNLINNLTIDNITADNKQNERILSLEFKCSAYGLIAGIIGFITSDIFVSLFNTITK